MKKLSLKNLKLEANDMLQRSQLKNVFGGYNGGYSGGCGFTTTYYLPGGNSYTYTFYDDDATKEDVDWGMAQALTEGADPSSTRWCCASCSSASWL